MSGLAYAASGVTRYPWRCPPESPSTPCGALVSYRLPLLLSFVCRLPRGSAFFGLRSAFSLERRPAGATNSNVSTSERSSPRATSTSTMPGSAATGTDAVSVVELTSVVGHVLVVDHDHAVRAKARAGDGQHQILRTAGRGRVRVDVGEHQRRQLGALRRLLRPGVHRPGSRSSPAAR